MRCRITEWRVTRLSTARAAMWMPTAARAATSAVITTASQVGSSMRGATMPASGVVRGALVHVGPGFHRGLDERGRVLAQFGLLAGAGELAVLAEDLHQLAIDLRVAGDALALLEEVRFAGEVADQATRFGHQQRACGHVPRRQAGLEEAFGEAGGDIGQVERSCA